MSTLQLFSDGGSRCNPGPSGLGIVGFHINVDGSKECIFEQGVYIKNCSNNVAEYLALVYGLNYALKSDYKHIEFFADSKLIVEQVCGRWKVKSPDLKELSDRAISKVAELRKQCERVTLNWVPREKNVHADSLANLAMDRQGSAEYRRDVKQKDKMQQHFEAMLSHEALVKRLTKDPKRADIRKLQESFNRLADTWSYLKM